MCIFSNQPAWMFFQVRVSQRSCVQTMGSRRGQRGSSIRIANPIRLSAGFLQNWQRGSARTLGSSFRFPPKRNLEWTAGELNAILENNLVPSHNGKGQLRTFGCIQWECELYSGRPKARCYPFNMKGHRFRGKNCQVLHMI